MKLEFILITSSNRHADINRWLESIKPATAIQGSSLERFNRLYLTPIPE